MKITDKVYLNFVAILSCFCRLQDVLYNFVKIEKKNPEK